MLCGLIGALLIAQDRLHPLFEFNPEALHVAYKLGTEEAKRKVKFAAVERRWAKDLGKVRSPQGQSWTAPYAVLLPARARAEFNGYDDAREYRDSTAFEDAVKKAQENPLPNAEKRFRFRAFLLAWPGISDYDHSINRLANPSDVRDVKFVVLIDGERPVHPFVRPQLQAEGVYDGSVAIPEYHTIYGQSSSTATGSATGPGGTVTGTATSRTSSTVTYAETRVESYSVYTAVYDLEFPLFDPQGKPYITESTKKLVLKVIRNDGEHSATFTLADYLKT